MTGSNIMQGYMEGIGVQLLAKHILINGLFVGNSDFVQMIIQKKKTWTYNDRFEYRMYLGGSGNIGTHNESLTNRDGSPISKANYVIGRYWATYGIIQGNIELDMFKNLETDSAQKALVSEYGAQLHLMRTDISNVFRNIAMHGKYIPVHRVMPPVISESGVLKYIPSVCAPGGKWVDCVLIAPEMVENFDAVTPTNKGATIIKYVAYTGRTSQGSAILSPNKSVGTGTDARMVSAFVDEQGRLRVPPGAAWICPLPVGGTDFSVNIGATIATAPTNADKIAIAPMLHGTRLRMRVPMNVFNSNYKKGTLLFRATRAPKGNKKDAYEGGFPIRAGVTVGTKGDQFYNRWSTVLNAANAPWGYCFMDEMYAVESNTGEYLELVYIGSNMDGVYDTVRVSGGATKSRADFFVDTTHTFEDADTPDIRRLQCDAMMSAPFPAFFMGEFFIFARNRKAPHNYWREQYKLETNAPAASSGTLYNKGYVGRQSGGNFNLDNWWWHNKDITSITDGLISHLDKLTLMAEDSGAMEGFADLIPLYTPYGQDSAENVKHRLGLNRVFRGAKDSGSEPEITRGRLFMQGAQETIMDGMLRVVNFVESTVGGTTKVVIMCSSQVMTAISQYERVIGANGMGLVQVGPAEVKAPFVYHRGVTGVQFKVREKTIPVAVQDDNFWTDCIIVAPVKEIFYNTIDQTVFQINRYIKSTFGKGDFPHADRVALPKEFCASLDVRRRLVVGNPYMDDMLSLNPSLMGVEYDSPNGAGFIHPSNIIPVNYFEMGALYIEQPFKFAVFKLGNQIIDPNDCIANMWNQADQHPTWHEFEVDSDMSATVSGWTA